MEQEQKNRVIEAIKHGLYEVEYNEPNNVHKHVRRDGSEYYVMVGDSVKFGVDAGSCTIRLCGFEIDCDYNEGAWSGSRDLLDDHDIMQAIKSNKKIITGFLTNMYDQMHVYALANGLDINQLEFYWCEDPECPRAEY